MPLTDIISAVTEAPARAVGWQDRLGLLQPGRQADITVLQLADADIMVEDSLGNKRKVNKTFIPKMVFKCGVLHKI